MTRAPHPSRPGLRLALLYLGTVVVVGALLYSVYGQRPRTVLTVGAPSPQTFIAPFDLELVDRIATERERQAARDQIEPVYTSDAELQRLVLGSVASSGLPEEVQTLVLSTYRQPDGVTEEELAALIREAVDIAPSDRRAEVRLLLERLLLPTSKPNVRATEAAREAAAATVPPVMQRLRAGEVIVRQGDPLTADHLRALESAGLYNPRSALLVQTLWIVLGCLLLAVVLCLPLFYAWRRLRTSLRLEQLAVLTLLTMLVLAAQRLALLAHPSLLLISLVPLLISVLISAESAILWAVWLAVITSLLAPTVPLFTLLAALVGGVAAALLARTYSARTTLLLAGVAGGLAAGLTLIIATLTLGGFSFAGTGLSALVMLGGGIAAGVIALGLLPLAESSFGFLTEFRLMELSSPSSPLLQKLLLEAPGSYQHSLIISNMVEQAVKAIGGNALLARVGALYHDVGKLRRPHFFVENQFSGENPHDKISPHLSYLIITSHVRDGIELLREYRLPRALEPFVAEHHGTTVLSFFYKRALEENASVDELNFRYPGPKPRSKETAVLMLADAVESASRTLTEPTQGSIRAMIERLVDQRLQDDQLSESPLNLHDLEVIINTFERMLTAILHRRISYPSEAEVRSLRRGGDSRRNEPVPLA